MPPSDPSAAPRRDALTRPRRSSLGFVLAIAVLLAGSVAIASGSPPPGSACPPRSGSEPGPIPLGCCSTSSDPRAHALGFAAALVGALWWAPRRSH